MPVPSLSSVATQDTFAEALTVVFSLPRPGFQLTVNNKAIIYQLAIPGSTGRAGDFTWEFLERNLVPSISSFKDPAMEGLVGFRFYFGIRIKSAVAGQPAVVSVN